MPKEIIRPFNDEFPHAVEIGWGINTYVQIGSIDTTKERYSPDAGFYVDLDRVNINKLIKVLRRARDQAYGRDE